MQYSLPYIYLVIFFLIISLLQLGLPFDEKSKRYLNGTAVIIYILFFGFRGFIGWDWSNYYPFFKEIPTLWNLKLIDYSYESGYVFFTSFVKTVYPDYHFYVFVNTLIDVALLRLFFRRYLPSNLFTLALATFIVMEGLSVEVNLIRNIKSILLFLISLKYIENRNLLKFLLLNILGVLFHWSAIFYFPLYFFLSKKIDLRIFIFIFILGNLIYLFQFKFVEPLVESISSLLGGKIQVKSDAYLNSKFFNSTYGISIGYLERVITSIVIMFYYDKLIEKSKSNILFINSFLIFFVVYFFFSEMSIIVTRVGILFFFSYWILWPQLINITTSSSRFLFFLFFSLYFNLRVVKMTDNILFRYDNILFDKYQTYDERVKIFDERYGKLQKKK